MASSSRNATVSFENSGERLTPTWILFSFLSSEIDTSIKFGDRFVLKILRKDRAWPASGSGDGQIAHRKSRFHARRPVCRLVWNTSRTVAKLPSSRCCMASFRTKEMHGRRHESTWTNSLERVQADWHITGGFAEGYTHEHLSLGFRARVRRRPKLRS